MSVKNEADFMELKPMQERDIHNIVFYMNKRYGLELDYNEVFERIENNN